MRRLIAPLLGLIWLSLLAACASATPAGTPQFVNVYASSAASPWLDAVYQCPSSAVIRLSTPDSADLLLRLGAPADLSGPAYQIATQDILVVVHPQVKVAKLNVDQVRRLFIGQVMNWKDLGGSDQPVQVWTYSPDEDIRQVFDPLVLNGQPVTSQARLAATVQDMSDSVANTPGSIGLLPRRWETGDTPEVFNAGSVPVLAILPSSSQGAVRGLIACLQK